MVCYRTSQSTLLLGAVLHTANAIVLPEPTVAFSNAQIPAPIVTPAAIRFDGHHSYIDKRDILDDIKSGVDGIAQSWASVLGTDLPSFFTEGTSATPLACSKLSSIKPVTNRL